MTLKPENCSQNTFLNGVPIQGISWFSEKIQQFCQYFIQSERSKLGTVPTILNQFYYQALCKNPLGSARESVGQSGIDQQSNKLGTGTLPTACEQDVWKLFLRLQLYICFEPQISPTYGFSLMKKTKIIFFFGLWRLFLLLQLYSCFILPQISCTQSFINLQIRLE